MGTSPEKISFALTKSHPISLVCIWAFTNWPSIPMKLRGIWCPWNWIMMGIVMEYLRWFPQWVVTPIWVENGLIQVWIFVGLNWMVQWVSKEGKECVNHESRPKQFWKSYGSDGLNLGSGKFDHGIIIRSNMYCDYWPLILDWVGRRTYDLSPIHQGIISCLKYIYIYICNVYPHVIGFL